MNPIKYITYLWINLSMQFFFYSPSFSLSLTHIQHILRRQHISSAQTRTHRSTVSTIFLINRQHVLLHLSQCQETHISVPVHWDYVKTNERRTRLLLREREKRTSLSKHTHTHTQHQVGDFRTCKKKKVPASYVLHFLLSTQQHSITPTPPPDGKQQ